jgi:hypothetical protein
MVLKLAEKYGQSPQDVENWDEFWTVRAVELMEGESLADEAKDLERDKTKPKR